MQQIYSKTPMGKHDLLKATQSNFTEITIPHGCSPVNLPHIFRKLFIRAPLGNASYKGAAKFPTDIGL